MASQLTYSLAVTKSDDKNANENEWGEFLHLPGEKFYDFNKIRGTRPP